MSRIFDRYLTLTFALLIFTIADGKSIRAPVRSVYRCCTRVQALRIPHSDARGNAIRQPIRTLSVSQFRILAGLYSRAYAAANEGPIGKIGLKIIFGSGFTCSSATGECVLLHDLRRKGLTGVLDLVDFCFIASRKG